MGLRQRSPLAWPPLNPCPYVTETGREAGQQSAAAHLDVHGEGEGPAGHLPLVVEKALQLLGPPFTQQRARLDRNPAEPSRCRSAWALVLQGDVGNAATSQQVARLDGDPAQQM